MTSSPKTVALAVRGPEWQEELSIGEQPGIAEHLAFMGDLVRRGVLEAAGPFAALGERLEGDVVGLLVFAEADFEGAARVLADEPAGLAGLLRWEVRRWHP
ncbi:MAG TPA: hypothetical protein VI503_01875 [Gaiellaceae bacterium]|nr:hypothetical protein [Gaiellaceae bacterium]